MVPAGALRSGASRARVPPGCFSDHYWADLAVEAGRGLLDFVTFEDSLSLQSSDRPISHS
jgi:hypothetical protein